jgi:NADH-quinone oxidoreductase subunit H
VGAFIFKVFFICWLFILIRWTLPRFRYDQVMRLGWKMLLPLALANVMVTAIWIIVRGA